MHTRCVMGNFNINDSTIQNECIDFTIPSSSLKSYTINGIFQHIRDVLK